MTTELPPIDWYRDPGLTEPTPVTITADGRIYGHVATWSSTHVGMPGRNVRPPKSPTDYSYFHTGGAVVSDAGQPVDISVGKLSLGTGHAPLTSDASDAASWYDNTGSIVATVCAGEDSVGIWYAGSVSPGVDDLQLHRLRASAISGDWRPVNGQLELVAALCVVSGGFPIPRARVASAADLVPLVAAGMVAPNPEEAVVAAPTPPPAPSDGPSPDGTVSIGDTGLVGRVVESTDGGDVVVEVTVSADMVHAADEQQAMAASAKLTQRQEMRSLRASVQGLSEQLAARDRADAAARLLEGVPAQQ